jgi:hypothetical protein
VQSDSGNKPLVKAEWDGGGVITVIAKRLPKEYHYKPAVCWGYGQQNQQNSAEELWTTRTYLPRIGFARLGCMISHGTGPELSRMLFPYKTEDESGKWVVLEILVTKVLRTDEAVFTFDLVYPKYRKSLLMGSSVLLPKYLYLLPVDQTHPERFRIGKVRKESMDSAEEDSKILVAEIQRKLGG